ncbi:hypothetical protein N9273_00640, partial [bacterium]|nr:hypothetical protein [bacterium]
PTLALGAGSESYIYYLSDPDDTSSTKIRIATSFGARSMAAESYFGPTNTGNLSTNGTGLADGESPYVIGGHIIPGASGGGDTNNGGEELNGSPSFWGGEKVAGAGTGGHNGAPTGTPADGFVKFEWGM